MKKLFIAIDLGGTNIKIGCFDSDLDLLCKTSIPTESDSGPESVVRNIFNAANKLLTDNNFTPDAIQAIGIGAPGPVDLEQGIIISSPNMPAFKNIPLRQMLLDKFDKPVAFENDANAACLGEFVAGAGKGVTDMIFLTLGTGIGGGVISNGKLTHGFGDNAAELGHTIIYPDGRLCGCGQKGCVEAYASADSVAKRATEAIQAGQPSSLKDVLETKNSITSKDVYQHAANGDTLAIEITEDTTKALGLLCVNLFHTSGPQRIVFAGGMIAAGDLLLSRIQHYFDQYIWPIKKESIEITFATLGQDAGIFGAAAMAIHKQK